MSELLKINTAGTSDKQDTDEVHINFHRDDIKNDVIISINNWSQSEKVSKPKHGSKVTTTSHINPALLLSHKKQQDEESNSSLSKLINRLDSEGKKI